MSIAAEMYPRFFITKPALSAPTVAGKNDSGPKIAPEGFRNIAMIEPIRTDMPPDMGPRMMPMRGADTTPSVIEPETPMVIVYGSKLKMACNAAKTAIKAILVVVKKMFLKSSSIFFTCSLCNFLHSVLASLFSIWLYKINCCFAIAGGVIRFLEISCWL